MKKIWIAVIGVFLFLSYMPDAQAQFLYEEYSGTFSASGKGTCEDYDNKGNIKLYTDTLSVSGSILFNKTLELANPCYLKFVFTSEEGSGSICITKIALVNTGMQKSKSEKFQIMGYGDFNLGGSTGIAFIDAKGNATKNQSGDIIGISISGGKLSGGDYWSHDVKYDSDCIWTATFSSNLSPKY